MDSHFNCALFKNKTYLTYKAAFVVQQLKQVAHPSIGDVTYDVTEKNAQECHTGIRRILALENLVQNKSK